ncbi:40S ribosomal protein S27-2-like [Cucurbita maxima]|uniref:40S ribosomal protein S27 n=1 Tax=Cucurbita maxima TaxID=3661 RepID=A0A6J1JM72_CUCMA|nr:40S ribosomal protein S27-2-like [Cucurbita maxima]
MTPIRKNSVKESYCTGRFQPLLYIHPRRRSSPVSLHSSYRPVSLANSRWDFRVRDPDGCFLIIMVLQNDIDLLNPPAELEKRKHKLKRLVQSPNSFFMDVKCQGCFNITTVFSHSQTVVVCGNCQTVLCQPTGGRARLTEGCSFRRKGD